MDGPLSPLFRLFLPRHGEHVGDRSISTADLMATICTAIGVDPKAQNISNVNRPICLVDLSAKPIDEILGRSQAGLPRNPMG